MKAEFAYFGIKGFFSVVLSKLNCMQKVHTDGKEIDNMDYCSLNDVKRRIDQNYECIRLLEKLIPLQKTDEEKAELLAVIGKMYAEYVTGQYASNKLEQEIIEIGKKISFQPFCEPERGNILIVMSEAGATGGHTVLVHNWIKWDEENTYSIVFSNMDKTSVPDFIEEAVTESGGNFFYLTGNAIVKAQTLLEISQKFERILLFTHMDDIVPALAYSNRNWSIPVYLYNHADFRFYYGLSIADVVLNLCEFDLEKSIRYRGVCQEHSVYFPFPGKGILERRERQIEKSKLRKIVEEKYNVKEDEKLIVSMGSDFKYESIIGYEFDVYVSDLLAQSRVECSFLIIGADKEKEKWIRLEERTEGKAKALGILPREEAELIIAAADLYVVAFPMWASGLGDAEQAGVPSLCLNIIGRYVEKEQIGLANSIPELIEKSLDVLYGNGNKYLRAAVTEKMSRQEWVSRLREIYNQFNYHTVHAFYPTRLIEKQEYINCQLMQKEAGHVLYHYLKSCSINEVVLKEIDRLDRVYNMGIVYAQAEYLKLVCRSLETLADNRLRLSQKHLELYKISLKWLAAKRKGKKIDQYLYSLGFHTVAIYGMGYMGRSLMEELYDSLIVELRYGIDRNASQISAEIPVYSLSDRLERVDVVLNTTVIGQDDILYAMGDKEVNVMQFSEVDRKSVV